MTVFEVVFLIVLGVLVLAMFILCGCVIIAGHWADIEMGRMWGKDNGEDTSDNKPS
ncbi:MAG: hypothetical protein PHR92_16345 [Lachnospiraceae bacterium]|nr:hypothetical protein [Lachnospiraceae bacterium]